MKAGIGYVIYSVRWNAIITFAIVQIITLYVTIWRPSDISATVEALWYSASLDCLISSAIFLALKNRKGVKNSKENFLRRVLFLHPPQKKDRLAIKTFHNMRNTQ